MNCFSFLPPRVAMSHSRTAYVAVVSVGTQFSSWYVRFGVYVSDPSTTVVLRCVQADSDQMSPTTTGGA